MLGDITGRRVLDIGSGAGHHAVHLAQAHGAHMTAIELSPTQHQRAVGAHTDVADVQFVQADVVDHLRTVEPFDAAYAIGTLALPATGAGTCRRARRSARSWARPAARCRGSRPRSPCSRS
ncbi:class I SAM-dependent methyltransferase [Streptomyces sp. NPDC005480]|uniref:SAM-dependent methyltransferase n=1 Tax=Streptomyces sp. NPDC005480 TaxID=3154880 RepID=UPI0033BB447A